MPVFLFPHGRQISQRCSYMLPKELDANEIVCSFCINCFNNIIVNGIQLRQSANSSTAGGDGPTKRHCVGQQHDHRYLH